MSTEWERIMLASSSQCLSVWTWLGKSLLIYAMMMSVGVFVLVARHGTIHDGVAHLERRGLVPDRSSAWLGSPNSDGVCSATFRLTNRSDHSIQILGAPVDCPGSLVTELPMAIQVGEAKELTYRVFSRILKGEASLNARVFTDDRERPIVDLTLRGVFPGIPNSSDRASR